MRHTFVTQLYKSTIALHIYCLTPIIIVVASYLFKVNLKKGADRT